MDLIIDIGNTLVKLAFFENRQLTGVKSQLTDSIEGITGLLQTDHFEAVIVSSVSVVPEKLLKELESISGKLIVLDKNIPLPVRNLYETPVTLGTDRIALAVAGAVKFPGENVLIIDAGTCITYDFVNSQKEYTGGAISPGLSMRLKALNSFTRRLPLEELADTNVLTGKNTRESILSGVVNGVQFEIDGFIQGYREKYPGLKTIITGGDSIFLANRMKSLNFAEPNLLLYGLEEILFFNK